jgi:hypothetical protein
MRPSVFILDDSSCRYLNPSLDKVAIFSLEEAAIVFACNVPNLQVWAIDEKEKRVEFIADYSQANNFYKGGDGG